MPIGVSRAGQGNKQLAFHVTSNANGQNLRTMADAAGYSGSGPCTITIDSGVTIGSTSTGTAALVRGTWPAGVVPVLINKGHIRGKAGAGGVGCNSYVPAGSGSPGGLALDCTAGAISIDNTSGSIDGGGGGGGGGGWGLDGGAGPCGGGGGGGGRGDGGGAGGAGGNPGGASFPGLVGVAGTSSAAGAGGVGGSDGVVDYGGAGGAGGGFGAAGGVGLWGSAGGGAEGNGGAAGGAVTGNSNITWVATGTRNGSVS